MLSGISILSIGDVNSLTQAYIPPSGFAWADLYKDVPVNLLLVSDNSPPPPVESWYWSIMNMVLYLVLSWYLDSVLPDEFGIREKPLFLFKRTYWGFKPKKKKEGRDLQAWVNQITAQYSQKCQLNQPKAPLFSRRKPTVSVPVADNPTEEIEVIEPRNESHDITTPAALRVLHLRKQFPPNFIALKDSNFVMRPSELLAIVGANGSGKSTTCHLLCGVTPATAGDALLEDEISLLTEGRGLVGWCPQHDILFDELTPLEHISLYASIKGVDADEMRVIAKDRLEIVRLWHRRDRRVGTFSGGMRRRLSMVLFTIGDPKLVILDEVTTGLDPVGMSI